jgi:hypothetical protein
MTEQETETETETVELSAEQVLEADEYAHNRTVREIQDARAEVRDMIKAIDVNPGDGASVELYQVTELANQTAVYVYEVMPLVRKGDIPDGLTELPESHPHDSIEGFAANMGMKPGADEPCGIDRCMQVYDLCNQITDELGIGVSLDKTGDGLDL